MAVEGWLIMIKIARVYDINNKKIIDNYAKIDLSFKYPKPHLYKERVVWWVRYGWIFESQVQYLNNKNIKKK